MFLQTNYKSRPTTLLEYKFHKVLDFQKFFSTSVSPGKTNKKLHMMYFY